jgi:diguanylate cyclase (GGDEF)-like protein
MAKPFWKKPDFRQRFGDASRVTQILSAARGRPAPAPGQGAGRLSRPTPAPRGAPFAPDLTPEDVGAGPETTAPAPGPLLPEPMTIQGPGAQRKFGVKEGTEAASAQRFAQSRLDQQSGNVPTYRLHNPEERTGFSVVSALRPDSSSEKLFGALNLGADAPKGLIGGARALADRPLSLPGFPRLDPQRLALLFPFAGSLARTVKRMAHERSYGTYTLDMQLGVTKFLAAQGMLPPAAIAKMTALESEKARREEETNYAWQRVRQIWQRLWTPQVPLEEAPAMHHQDYDAWYAQDKATRLQLRGEAVDLRRQAYTLLNQPPTLESLNAARTLITQAHENEQRAVGFFDPTWAYSFEANPELRTSFQAALVEAEMQKGAPLEYWEIFRIKDNFVDIWEELPGEVLLDLYNFIPATWISKPLDLLRQKWGPALLKRTGKPSLEVIGDVLRTGGFLKAGTATLATLTEPLPVVGDTVRWLAQQSYRSAGERVMADSSDVLQRLARTLDTDQFTAVLDAAQKAQPLRNARLGQRETDILRSMRNILDGEGAWAELVDNARTRIGDAVRVEVQERLAKLPAIREIADVTARNQALQAAVEKELDEFLANPRNLVREIASEFRDQYLKIHTLPGTGVLNDNLMVQIASRLGVLEQVKPGIQLVNTLTSWLANNWITATLRARPAWVVNNAVDSFFRYMVTGGALFDDLGSLADSAFERAELLDFIIPADLTEAMLRRDLPHGEQTVDRLLRGWKPRLGPLSFLMDDWKRVRTESGGSGFLRRVAGAMADGRGLVAGLVEGTTKAPGDSVRAVRDGWKAWANGWTDFNAAIEFTLRLRLYHKLVNGFYTNLETRAMPRVFELVKDNPRLFPIALSLWQEAGKDPERLAKLLQEFLGQAGQATPLGFSRLVPPDLDQHIIGMTAEARAVFSSHVLGALRRAKAQGDLSESVIRTVFADIERQMDELLANQTRRFEQMAQPTGEAAEAVAELGRRGEPRPGAVDRRGDFARRGEIDQMDPAQRAEVIQTLREENARLQAENRVDTRTGLPNQRAFEEAIGGDDTLRVVMDANGLKYLNDTYGHEAGDALLRTFKTLADEAGLTLYRTGGDEFAAINLGIEQANALREAMRTKVIEFIGADGQLHRLTGLTFSFGRGNAHRAEAALKAMKQADVGIYRAAPDAGGRSAGRPPSLRDLAGNVPGAAPQVSLTSLPRQNPLQGHEALWKTNLPRKQVVESFRAAISPAADVREAPGLTRPRVSISAGRPLIELPQGLARKKVHEVREALTTALLELLTQVGGEDLARLVPAGDLVTHLRTFAVDPGAVGRAMPDFAREVGKLLDHHPTLVNTWAALNGRPLSYESVMQRGPSLFEMEPLDYTAFIDASQAGVIRPRSRSVYVAGEAQKVARAKAAQVLADLRATGGQPMTVVDQAERALREMDQIGKRLREWLTHEYPGPLKLTGPARNSAWDQYDYLDARLREGVARWTQEVTGLATAGGSIPPVTVEDYLQRAGIRLRWDSTTGHLLGVKIDRPTGRPFNLSQHNPLTAKLEAYLLQQHFPNGAPNTLRRQALFNTPWSALSELAQRRAAMVRPQPVITPTLAEGAVPAERAATNRSYTGVVTRDQFWGWARGAFGLKTKHLSAIQRLWDNIASVYAKHGGGDWYEKVLGGYATLARNGELPAEALAHGQVPFDFPTLGRGGGLTFNPFTGHQVVAGEDTGFAVATAIPGRELPAADYFASAESQAEALSEFAAEHIQDLLEGNRYVGAYHDAANRDVVYLDISEVFADEAEAIRYGIERQQESIFRFQDFGITFLDTDLGRASAAVSGVSPARLVSEPEGWHARIPGGEDQAERVVRPGADPAALPAGRVTPALDPATLRRLSDFRDRLQAERLEAEVARNPARTQLLDTRLAKLDELLRGADTTFFHTLPNTPPEAARPWVLRSRLLLEKMPRRQKASDVAGFLRGKVSEAELKWTGLGDMLAARGDGFVTRDEILRHLDEHQPQIQELVYGEGAKLADPLPLHWVPDNWLLSRNDDNPIYQTPNKWTAFDGLGREWVIRPGSSLDGGGLNLHIPREYVGDYPKSTIIRFATYEEAIQQAEITMRGMMLDPRVQAFTVSDYLHGYSDFHDDLIESAAQIYSHADNWPEDVRQLIEPVIAGFNRHKENKRLLNMSQVKWAGYKLPGGKNYRELLLMWPQPPDPIRWTTKDLDPNKIANGGVLLNAKRGTTALPYAIYHDQLNPERYVVTDARQGNSNTVATLNSLAEAQQWIETHTQEMAYNSDYKRWAQFHQDRYKTPEPVLVHIRFDERATKDGRRVLFLEEVQSDWFEQLEKQTTKQRKLQRFVDEHPEIIERHSVLKQETDALHETWAKLQTEVSNRHKAVESVVPRPIGPNAIAYAWQDDLENFLYEGNPAVLRRYFNDDAHFQSVVGTVTDRRNEYVVAQKEFTETRNRYDQAMVEYAELDGQIPEGVLDAQTIVRVQSELRDLEEKLADASEALLQHETNKPPGWSDDINALRAEQRIRANEELPFAGWSPAALTDEQLADAIAWHSDHEIMLEEPHALRQRIAERRGVLQNLQSQEEIIADAPFSQNWQELAFKRMARWAAENGYDAVGWTTAKQQANRYTHELLGVVDELIVVPRKTYKEGFSDRISRDKQLAGNYVLIGNKNGEQVTVHPMMELDELDGLIGSQIAKDLRGQLERQQADRIENQSARVVGQDFVVGGQRMKIEYDQNLPQYARKLGKGFGVAPRLDDIELKSTIVDFQIVKSPDGTVLAELDRHLTWSEIQAKYGEGAYAEHEMRETNQYEPSHLLDLNDEMKAGVKAGQTLFHTRQEVATAAVQFMNDGRAFVYAFQGAANAASLIHETFHILRRNLRAGDLEVLGAWAGRPVAEWGRAEEELFAKAGEKYLAEGIAPNASLVDTFNYLKDLLLYVYRTITGYFEGVEVTPELRRLFDRHLGGADVTPADLQEFLPDKALQALRNSGDPLLREAFDDELRWLIQEVKQVGFEGDFQADLLRERHWWATILEGYPEVSRHTLVRLLEDELAHRVTVRSAQAEEIITRAYDHAAFVLTRGRDGLPTNPYVLERIGASPERVAYAAKQMAGLGVEDVPTWLAQKRDRRLAEELNRAWEAWVNAPRYPGNRSVRDTWGEAVTQSQAGFAAHLRDEQQRLRDRFPGRADDMLDALRVIEQEAESFGHQALAANRALLPDELTAREAELTRLFPVAIPAWQLPEDMATWLLRAEDAIAAHRQAKTSLRYWGDWLAAQAAQGDPLMRTLDETDRGTLRLWGQGAATAKYDLLNTAMHGGELDGLTITGALPTVNKHMLYYGDSNHFDELMKTVFPFWMFPSRSIPFWVEYMASHPWLPAAYAVLLRNSQRYAYQADATTSDGRQLPSLEGYLPIPGTKLWFNPAASLSFRYALPRLTQQYNDIGEAQSPVQQVYETLRQMGQTLGFSLAPWATLPLTAMGVQDANRIPGWSLVPQLDLIPPWIERDMLEKIARAGFPNAPHLWRTYISPQPGWQDFLYERELLRDTLAQMEAPQATAEQRMALALAAQTALLQREGDPLWDATVAKIEQSDYYTRLSGYFTGFFPREFSDAAGQFNSLRDEVNLLRDAVNDGVSAELFTLDPDPAARYRHYLDKRYETPEGYLLTLYGTIRFTQAPNGDALYGDARRELVTQNIHEEQSTQAYFDALGALRGGLEQRLAVLPIGAEATLTNAVWDWYRAERLKIESEPMYASARRSWVVGMKPDVLLDEHYRELWMELLRETAPEWDRAGGQSFADYKSAQAAWQEDLPNQALGIYAAFVAAAQDEATDEADLKRIMATLTRLRGETTYAHYRAWQLGRDTAYDALNEAWKALYWNQYWDFVSDKSGHARTLAEQTFLSQHPAPPSPEQLAAWVLAAYPPGQFKQAELVRLAQARPIESVQSRLEEKTAEGKLREQAWEILGWIAPGGPARGAFEDAYEAAGGFASDIDVFMSTNGAWSDPTKLAEFVERLQRVARATGLGPPPTPELTRWITAQGLNDLFRSQATTRFGEDIFTVIAAYGGAFFDEQRKMRERDPRIEAYYALREHFGEVYPEWAMYYLKAKQDDEDDDKTSGGRAGRSGGARSAGRSSGGSRRSGTSGGRRTGGGGGGGSARPASPSQLNALLRDTWVGMAYRSTNDPNALLDLDRLGRGSVAKAPRWPAALWERYGPPPPGLPEAMGDRLVNEVAGGLLSAPATAFLKDLAGRHPEWRASLEAMLQQTQPPS